MNIARSRGPTIIRSPRYYRAAVAMGMVAFLGVVTLASGVVEGTPSTGEDFELIATSDWAAPKVGSALSDDGRFLVITDFPLPTEGSRLEVFVLDRETGAKFRVSESPTGSDANGHSWPASISGDGRWVGFASRATNLVDGSETAPADWSSVFLHDRQGDTTRRVSQPPSGEPNGNSSGAQLSRDGSIVAFWSSASNLIDGDANGREDVFVYDAQTGSLELVSVQPSGGQFERDARPLMASWDGGLIGFGVWEPFLGQYDIFVRDRATGTTHSVGCATSGAAFSQDLRFVVYVPCADVLPARAMLLDRQLGTSKSLGAFTEGSSSFLVSADGSVVIFATDLRGERADLDHRTDTYLIFTATNRVVRVSVDSNGANLPGHNFGLDLTPDGRFLLLWDLSDPPGSVNTYLRNLNLPIAASVRHEAFLGDVARD